MNLLSFEPIDSFENLDSIFELESDSKELAENKMEDKTFENECFGFNRDNNQKYKKVIKLNFILLSNIFIF
jgi:hypothetical protein